MIGKKEKSNVFRIKVDFEPRGANVNHVIPLSVLDLKFFSENLSGLIIGGDKGLDRSKMGQID